MITAPFLLSVGILSLVFSTIIGMFVQYIAFEAELGPAPRMFIGMGFNVLLITGLVTGFGVLRLFIPLLAVYYIGTYQIGMPIMHVLGFEAPEDNDPPEVFWRVVNMTWGSGRGKS
jgi:hypothetical protein